MLLYESDFCGGAMPTARERPQGSQKSESGGNPGQEKLHGPIPAALQPGLQPHRDGDLQTEKRAAKAGRARRRRPIALLESCAGLFKPADCQSYFKACGYHPAELRALDTT